MKKGYSRYKHKDTNHFKGLCLFAVEHQVHVFVFVQVVQKKEAHDYRCLFRVCFMPRVLQLMLQEDPTAFMYLYLQVDGSNYTPGCIVA